MNRALEGKRILVTGGTGSLGQTLVRRILSGGLGTPEKVIVLSRDEAKQHEMRLSYKHARAATDEIIYHNFEERLEFRIGDVRDLHSVTTALQDVDIVFNAAALKQVPTCEYFPQEAVMTNILGAENLIRAITESRLPVETVVGVSTDKACKPVNVMGMTKALQERVFIQANIRRPETRFVCVRYGNVLTSRGSVIPLFQAQIDSGGPVTITTPEMTRFLLTLDEAVDTVFAALQHARRGETYVPKVPSATIIDVARALIGEKDIEMVYTGIRPGEKFHEILISEEESYRTIEGPSGYYALQPMLPELVDEEPTQRILTGEYSSANSVMERERLVQYLSERLPYEAPSLASPRS
ncbi:MAG: polysaccharide biosynthesis protein [Actinomycetota bacterium]